MSKKIILKSSDHEVFEVEQSVAIQSKTIAHMIEDDCIDNGIPLPNVSSKILSKVLAYCKQHVEAEASKKADGADSSKIDADLKKWDAEFVDVEQSTIYELILAANYLDIPSLLDRTCQAVADSIKGKTPDQLRSHFNITKDFTPEEEEKMLKENHWVFDN